MSEEIEYMLREQLRGVDPFTKAYGAHTAELLRVIGSAIKLAEIGARGSWRESEKAYDAAMSAIDHVKALVKRPVGSSVAANQASPSDLSLASQLIVAASSDRRAAMIGMAAAGQAVNWRMGNYEQGAFFDALLKGGTPPDEANPYALDAPSAHSSAGQAVTRNDNQGNRSTK